MGQWRRWITGASVLGTLVAFVLSGETSYEWRDTPPPESSIVRLEGSLTRNFFRIGGLSLQARFSDGFRLSWIGGPSHVPAGLVESELGVHLVLVEWALPRGEEGRVRRTLVCWVRDGRPGAPTVVVPLFTPEPLVSGIQLRWGRFMPVDAELVRNHPRMSTEELLRRHAGQRPGGACPNLFLADGV
jgi:hypothetical protein